MSDNDLYGDSVADHRADQLLRWGVAEHRRKARRQEVLDRTAQLDAAITDTRDEVALVEQQRAIQAAKVTELEALLDRRRSLTEDMFELVRRESARRAEIRAADRRLDALRRRRDRLPTARRGISVRIAVDNDAWSTLAQMARSEHSTLAAWMGRLIDAECARRPESIGSPSSRRRRSPGEGDPVPVRRSLRVHSTDDALDLIRDTARAVSLTFERYIGEIAEADAFQRGWRANPHDAA